MRPLLILAFLATSLAGCSTTKRSVTHINWYQEEGGSSAYIAYWEGDCTSYGCGRGDSHIKLCSVAEDNSLTCKPQDAADKLLNPHR